MVTRQPLGHACWLAVLEPLVGHLSLGHCVHAPTPSDPGPAVCSRPLITSGVIWNVAFFMAMGGREGKGGWGWAQSQGSLSHHPPIQMRLLVSSWLWRLGSTTPFPGGTITFSAWKLFCLLRCVSKSSKKLAVEKSVLVINTAMVDHTLWKALF